MMELKWIFICWFIYFINFQWSDDSNTIAQSEVNNTGAMQHMVKQQGPKGHLLPPIKSK